MSPPLNTDARCPVRVCVSGLMNPPATVGRGEETCALAW